MFDGLKPANGLNPNGLPWKFGAPDSDCAESLFHQLNPNGELNWLPNWFPKKDHGVLNQFHALNGDHWFQPVKDCDHGEKLLKPWKPWPWKPLKPLKDWFHGKEPPNELEFQFHGVEFQLLNDHGVLLNEFQLFQPLKPLKPWKPGNDWPWKPLNANGVLNMCVIPALDLIHIGPHDLKLPI